MQRNLTAFLLIGLWCPSAWAACLTVDASTWTQAERNQRIAAAYSLAFAAGHDEVPMLLATQVCFTTFDPTGVLTAAGIKAQADGDLAAARAVQTQRATDRAAFQTEISMNDLCTASLAELDSRIDAAFSTASTASQIKTVTIAVLKKIDHCVRARAR